MHILFFACKGEPVNENIVSRGALIFRSKYLAVKYNILLLTDAGSEYKNGGGVWKFNINPSSVTGDGGLALHYIYNRKHDVSITAKNGCVVLIEGISFSPENLISFSRNAVVKSENGVPQWVLSDPTNKDLHMVKNYDSNAVVFRKQSECDSLWVF
jgi:hypothetical protein